MEQINVITTFSEILDEIEKASAAGKNKLTIYSTYDPYFNESVFGPVRDSKIDMLTMMRYHFKCSRPFESKNILKIEISLYNKSSWRSWLLDWIS